MRSDLVLGVVTVAMALLGTVVTLHAPSKFGWKLAYFGAFLVLGVIAVVSVIKQSNENAVTNGQLRNSIQYLTNSTAEISRMTNLNTQLQERLLDSSKTISDLSKQNIEAVTGGKDYPIVTPLLLPVINPNTFALVATVSGKVNSLTDVRYRIFEGRPPYHVTEDDLRGELAQTARQFVYVGSLHPGRGEILMG